MQTCCMINNGVTGRFWLLGDILCQQIIVELLEYLDCLKTFCRIASSGIVGILGLLEDMLFCRIASIGIIGIFGLFDGI